VSSPVPFETFPALELPFLAHAFIQRIPGVDVKADRSVALERLEQFHAQVRTQLGFNEFAIGEQVHGNQIAVITKNGDCAAPSGNTGGINSGPIPGVDGLITNRPGLCLGVQVADCCPVYLVDPVQQCIGLVHSGRKGTEQGIAVQAIAKMKEHFGSQPADLLVQLGPCIRPPLYEVDIAQEIIRQCQQAGVTQVFDCGANTGEDLLHYYSYRVEKGKTGRMLGLLGIKAQG